MNTIPADAAVQPVSSVKSVQSAQATSERLHALDAVRSYALLLGVVLHSTAAFLPGFPVPQWVLEPSVTASVIYYVIHFSRMSAFYFIAGFFARMMLERRGVQGFVKDRSKRILLPLVVGVPVVGIIIVLFLCLGALPHGKAYLTSLTARPPGVPAPQGFHVDLIHLWFLYYLLIFYAIALALRTTVQALDSRGSLSAISDKVIAFIMRGVWAPVLLALPAALYYWQFQHWSEWLGLPAPSSLVPDVGALIGYGVAFGIGWMLHRQIPTLLALRDRWLIYFAMAVVLTVVCLEIIGPVSLWTSGPHITGATRAVYAVAYMTGVWCWVFSLVGLAIRFLSDHRPATRYLADASYWIYLMHMAPILFFITLLRPYHLPWAVNLLLILAGSMPILLLSYHYLVRFTWVGAILNGRRHPRATRAAATASDPTGSHA
jgi:glucan biosynthesis protein C